jgi:hypothetical protein
MSLDQRSTETDVSPARDTAGIEGMLKSLWEKARHASELIGRLREERERLQLKAQGLENELAVTRQEMIKKDDIIKKLREDKANQEMNRSALLSNGEREALTARVRDLLAKIDAYL